MLWARLCAAQVVTFRFLSREGPFRQHLVAWANGEVMHEPMYRELLSYATALVSMQRLEGRHSVLKRALGWKHFQLPASLSATMRRRQNKDLENPEFEKNLAEYLSEIGSLHQGTWHNKTELLEGLARASAQANYSPMTLLRSQKDAFVAELSRAASSSTGDCGIPPLYREHLKACMAKGKFCAIPGLVRQGSWSLFRVLHMNPAANMYLQKASHLASDDSWNANKSSKFKIQNITGLKTKP